MMEEKKDFKKGVGRNAKYAVLQTVISAFVVFVLYKYLYSRVGPDALGLWTVVVASVSLGKLAELGFSTTVLRFVSIYLSSGNKDRAARILETGVVSIGLFFGLLLILIYPVVNIVVVNAVPLDKAPEARALLPYSIASLWVGLVCAVAQSALDGCGRMDVKSKILIFSNVFYVAASIFLVNKIGVVGLALAQLTQSGLILVVSWYFLRKEIVVLRLFPVFFDRGCFKEIFSYALAIQVGNLLVLCFEPITKIIISRYFGLTEVAHFEMANQVISRARALVSSGVQAYLPLISASANDTELAKLIVGEALVFTVGLGVPVIAMAIVSLPMISFIWIGTFQYDFVLYGWLLGIGWVLATVAMPVYFYCVGSGRVRVILVSQAAMVVVNALTGFFSARVFGVGAVVFSMMFSLVLGNLMIGIDTFRCFRLKVRNCFGSKVVKKNIVLLLCVLAVVLSSVVLFGLIETVPVMLFLCLCQIFALSSILFFSDAKVIFMSRRRSGGA